MKYEVTVQYNCIYNTTVEAESEEEAMEIAEQEAENAKPDDFQWEHSDTDAYEVEE